MQLSRVATWYTLLNFGLSRHWLYRQWQRQGEKLYDLIQHLAWWQQPYILRVARKKSVELNPMALARGLKIIQSRLNLAPQLFWIGLGDDDYPIALTHLTDPPPCIAVQGQFEAWSEFLADKKIAIVGSRQLGLEGKRLLEQILPSKPEAWILSGLASGADTLAHDWSLIHGHPVVVIGSGHLKLSGWQKDLAQKIIPRGLIISEYLPDEPAKDWHFPERNRLLAALAEKIIVLAATEKSGTLITAHLGIELGRDVYAVPWSPLSKFSAGSNGLIAQGAIPLYSAEQLEPIENQTITNKLNQAKTIQSSRTLKKLDPISQKIIDNLELGPISISALLANLNLKLNSEQVLDLKQVLTLLANLAEQNLIKENMFGQWERV